MTAPLANTSLANARSTDRGSNDQLARPDWLPKERWPFDLRRFRYPGTDGPIDIHYTDTGGRYTDTGDSEAATFVFIHAGMWSFIWRDAMLHLQRELSQSEYPNSEYRCITLDFPGTGLSGGTAADIDLATYPDLLNQLLDHCGVHRATFVIHDLGGVVGVLAAADRPDRVDGLVATNSFSWAPDRLSLKTMLAFVGSRPATATLGTLRFVPRLTTSNSGVGRHLETEDRKAFLGPYQRRTYSRNFHRTMRSAANATRAFDQAEAALSGPLSHLPVMTVFGEKNDPFQFEARWRSLFPDATSWVVDGGNHFPMCDAPDEYASRLRTWHDRHIALNIGPAAEL